MGENNTEKKERKQRYNFRVNSETLDIVKKWYQADNCENYNEFIEKAIQFYGGYIAAQQNENYYPQVFISTVKSALKDTEYQLNKQLFRVAVELSIIKNILATNEGITSISLSKLQGKCVEEVKRINGVLSTEEAIKWQS